jgi:hypothetical protein
MGIDIIAHIGIPFVAGVIGLDLTILSAGACGGIFANPTLIPNLGGQ